MFKMVKCWIDFTSILFYFFINIIIILLFNEKLSLGVLICLDHVSIESLHLDIVKKFVTTVEKILTGFKSWSRQIEKSWSRLVSTVKTPKLVRNTHNNTIAGFSSTLQKLLGETKRYVFVFVYVNVCLWFCLCLCLCFCFCLCLCLCFYLCLCLCKERSKVNQLTKFK